jgi:predicted SprT family Zn-dependent metalloprotease
MQLDLFARLFKPTTAPRSPALNAISPADDVALTQSARELLGAIGYAEFAQQVRVRWNARMRSTAGCAFPREALITLNPRVREFGLAEIDRTLRHELAHLLAHHRSGRRRIAPHGREWRQACIDLGLPDEQRCHSLPLPRRKIAPRYRYRCAACGIELKRVRPLRKRSACLACCRLHSRGRYDERFRFVKVAAPAGTKWREVDHLPPR